MVFSRSAVAGVVTGLCVATAMSQPELPIPTVPREFRGVWVATVANIDWPSTRRLSAEEQQSELREIIERAADLNMNAIVFQIRPACDALYRSEIEPWSYYLTGEEGRDPGWDPLEFAVRESHARGIELHCWLNPFRAKKGPYEHSGDHIANTNPDIVHSYGEGQEWLDPGSDEAQAYSHRVVMDVVRRYDIDGVHFDDYFYPYQIEDRDFPDDDTYRAYRDGGGELERNDWRRDNINRFLRNLSEDIHETKPTIRFGLSPFGIWRPGHPEGVRGLDAYNSLYADAREWLRRGWVDYLAPQLYWPVESEGQPFRPLLEWWVQQNAMQRHIWPGLATYHVGGEGDWTANQILRQIRITREVSPADPGTIHFSEIALRENREGLADALKEELYARDALVPASPWLDNEAPQAPEVSMQGQTLSWEPADAEDSWLTVIQARWRDGWVHQIVPGSARERRFPLQAEELPSAIAVSTVDRVGNISEPTIIIPENNQ